MRHVQEDAEEATSHDVKNQARTKAKAMGRPATTVVNQETLRDFARLSSGKERASTTLTPSLISGE